MRSSSTVFLWYVFGNSMFSKSSAEPSPGEPVETFVDDYDIPAEIIPEMTALLIIRADRV